MIVKVLFVVIWVKRFLMVRGRWKIFVVIGKVLCFDFGRGCNGVGLIIIFYNNLYLWFFVFVLDLIVIYFLKRFI